MACRVCRARKVKCDGRPNGCRNCEHLRIECFGENGLVARQSDSPFSSLSPDRSSFPHVSMRRTRTYRSCVSCRLSKTKCSGDRPRCSRCSVKMIECMYDGGVAPRWTKRLYQLVKGEGDETKDREDNKGFSEDTDVEGNTFMSIPGSRRAAAPTTPSFGSESNYTYPWLLSPNLPTAKYIRQLVEHYFANIHPIRCFAFVHKPSFMRKLDSGFNSDDDSALLHIICAHGAKFFALSLEHFDKTPNAAYLHTAGNQWAKRAETLIMGGYGKISIHRLMTTVLLHDFRVRLGDHCQALMLSSFAVRMAQALEINNEDSTDILCAYGVNGTPSVVSRESRRRLMWACYVIDLCTGREAEHLTMLREKDIEIQLPSNDRNFELGIPSITETLRAGHVLQFLPPAMVPSKPVNNMDIMAHYIRIVSLGNRISKYINNPEATSPPWLPESEFSALDAALSQWRHNLPDYVEYSPDTIYARLDSNQLGGLLLIHSTYHHNCLTLYKISMPELVCSTSVPIFPVEHRQTLRALQTKAYVHARQISRLLAEVAEHGIRLLSDSVLPLVAYDSSLVMQHYVAQTMDSTRVDAEEESREATEAVAANKRLLKMMVPLFPISETLATIVERWLSNMRRDSIEPLTHRVYPSEDVSSTVNIGISPYFCSAFRGSSEFDLPPISASRQGPI